jgi:hypothetical protein
VGRPEGLDAVFVAEDGVEQRVPWSFVPDVVAKLGRARCGRSRPTAGSGTIPAGTGRPRWAARLGQPRMFAMPTRCSGRTDPLRWWVDGVPAPV